MHERPAATSPHAQAARLARSYFEACRDRDVSRLRRLLHPECRVQWIASARSEAMLSLEETLEAVGLRPASITAPRIANHEILSEDAVVLTGSAMDSNHILATYVWLVEVLDSSIHRVRVFHTKSAAVAVYAEMRG